jgi:hypothetical protein
MDILPASGILAKIFLFELKAPVYYCKKHGKIGFFEMSHPPGVCTLNGSPTLLIVFKRTILVC